MKDQVKSNPTSPYWQHVGISLAQVREAVACLPHPQQANKHLILVMVMLMLMVIVFTGASPLNKV